MRLYRPHSPILVLIFSLLVFLIGDNLIFRSGLFNHLLFNRSGGAITQMYRAASKIKHFDSKEEPGVLLLGSSEFRYPTDPQIVNSIPGVKINLVTPRGTTPEEWYYLLKTNDPQRDKYKLMIIGLPYYKAPPENRQKEYLEIPRNLANFVSWSDYWDILSGYPDLGDKLELAKYKLFPSRLYSDGFLMALFVDPLVKLKSYFKEDTFSNLKNFREQRFLTRNKGVWNDAIFDSQGNLVQCKSPQTESACKLIEDSKHPISKEDALKNTQQNSDLQRYWVQKIIDFYKGSHTKVVFIKLPSPPGITNETPLAQSLDIRERILLSEDSSFIDGGYFDDLATGSLMHDPYHLSPTAARPIFTPRLIKIIKQNLPS